MSDTEYRAGLISHGVPEPRADLLVGLFAASRKGEFAAVDPTLERPARAAAVVVARRPGGSPFGRNFAMSDLNGHDAGVWPKGILSDEYGVTPDQSRWIVGGLDWPMKPIDFIPHLHPANVEVTWAPAGTDLGAMLEAGEIDALISANVPKCVLSKSPKVARLFPDYIAVEREYYQRTGIFPIMHTVVIRRDLVAQHPDLARTIYRGLLLPPRTLQWRTTGKV